MNLTRLYFFLLVFLFANATNARTAPIIELLKKRIPGIEITELEQRDHYSQVFEIMLEQPLDHQNPAAGTFQQRIFLAHTNVKRPMVIVTQGYAIGKDRTTEVAEMLQANQLNVEYRFCGKSTPKQMDWKYLTNDQATEDLHRIRKLFGKIYRKRWASTGISKGGTTALIYKSKYPKDVCAAIPYVAPLAFAQEDPRTDQHQKNIGTDECRANIAALQKEILRRRESLIPMIDTFASNHNVSFSLSKGAVLEYAALEYPFSFWQWGHSCDQIPTATVSDQELFTYLNDVVSFNFYSDATYKYFEPAFYQFVTELGYYGFPKEHLQSLLIEVPEPSNLIFAPKNTDLTFTPYLKPVHDFLMKKGDRIIYIYGELDTWTACGVRPSSHTNAIRLEKKGGSHATRIADFGKVERQQVYQRLKKWMKIKEIKALE